MIADAHFLRLADLVLNDMILFAGNCRKGYLKVRAETASARREGSDGAG